MNKQVKLYSIKLWKAKTKEEKELTIKKNQLAKKMTEVNDRIATKVRKDLKKEEKEWDDKCKEEFDKIAENDTEHIQVKKDLEDTIRELNEMLKKHTGVRRIEVEDLKEKNKIAIFEDALTRTLGIENSTLTMDFLVIDAKKEDNNLIQQVMINGLIINDEKYEFFTAGAGQTRNTKFMMIKESVWAKYQEHLMCGLTIDKINKMGGMNINKFLAYLSLNNSASDVIEGFDINKCIVVDDFETIVTGEVDYISRDDRADNGTSTYINKDGKTITRKKTKTKWDVQRQTMGVPVPFMDGCGICLTTFSRRNMQVRLPWIKGLLVPTNFKKFAKRVAKNDIVTDIYGKQYDIIKDDIQIIFTKSMFKMWDYYKNIVNEETGKVVKTGWEVYQECFKKYNCTANLCKKDELNFKNKTINYQMLQTLTEMTDEHITLLTQPTKDFIKKVHTDREAQLEMLGAKKEEEKKNGFEKILTAYPQLLKSVYVNKQISDAITSLKEKVKSGRIKLNCKRTFLIPDVYAFMEMLFCDVKNPTGLLQDGEVYCNLYKEKDKLAVLRSPHLSREWAIRKNLKKADNDLIKQYFVTAGIYTSCNDLISKILQFDNDGDEALVVAEDWMIDLAEKQMENIRPLYYEMGKADKKQITKENIYTSLKFAYQKNNIGKVSNAITGLWNVEKPDDEENIKNIKLLCAYNNWVIDSAKTLEVPKIPSTLYKKITGRKCPNFFVYAKKKKAEDVQESNNSVMNRIVNSMNDMGNTRFEFDKSFGSFRTTALMNNKKIEIKDNVIEFYLELEEKTRKGMNDSKQTYDKDSKISYKAINYQNAREKVLEYAEENGLTISDIADMIIKYTYKKDQMKMAFVFEVFATEILENLKPKQKEQEEKPKEEKPKETKKTKAKTDCKELMCVCCGKKFIIKNNNQKYCSTTCSKEVNRAKTNANKKAKKVA